MKSGEALRVDQLQAGRHVERGRAADDQQPLRVFERVEQGLDVEILELDREHDRVGAVDRGGDAGLVGEIGLDRLAVADGVAAARDRDVSWPRRSASATMRWPTLPVAPITAILILSLLSARLFAAPALA